MASRTLSTAAALVAWKNSACAGVGICTWFVAPASVAAALESKPAGWKPAFRKPEALAAFSAAGAEVEFAPAEVVRRGMSRCAGVVAGFGAETGAREGEGKFNGNVKFAGETPASRRGRPALRELAASRAMASASDT